MIKVIFFDVDNTLLSFSGYVKETMRKGFAYFGLRPYEESMFYVFEEINNSLWKQIEEGTLTFEELISVRFDLVFKKLNISFDGKTFETYFRQELNKSAVLEPNVADVLQYLSEKYTLCVASNGPYNQQINRLKIGNIHDYFSYFFISEKIGASKPSTKFFDYCFKELSENGFTNLNKDEVMIVGDSISSDIGGGKAYGLLTCLYNKNNKINNDFSNLVDYEIDDLIKLKEIL